MPSFKAIVGSAIAGVLCLLVGLYCSCLLVSSSRAQAESAKPLPAVHLISDADILNAENWHTASFKDAKYVIYTGPGQIMFHHWLDMSGGDRKSTV